MVCGNVINIDEVINMIMFESASLSLHLSGDRGLAA